MMNDRECPNGWSDCLNCSHEEQCRKGFYHGEENRLVEVAEIIEKQIDKEVAEGVKILKALPEEDFWAEWGKYSTPNLHAKEPYKCMYGPTAPGGGGMKGAKKSTKGCKPTVYVWGVFK